MKLERISRMVPESLRDVTSKKLIDIVLISANANKMPSHLAKSILHYWQRDQLATEIGLQRLLEAAMILETEKTISAIEDLGLQEVVIALRKL